MYEEKSIEIGRTIFLTDVLATSITYMLAVWLKIHVIDKGSVDYFSYFALLPLVLLFVVWSLSYFGGYESPHCTTLFEYGWIVARAIAVSLGALLTILFLLKIDYISRMVILSFVLLEFISLVVIRACLKKYHSACVRNGKSSSRVLIIGTGDRAIELSQKLRNQSEWGIEIVGHLDPDRSRIGQKILDAPVIGTVCDIERIFKENVIDEVIIAITRSMLTDAEPIAQACEEEGIKLRFMADIFNLEVARTRLIKLGDIPILTLEPVAQDEIKLMVKRAFDLIVTIASLPLVVPLMTVIAIAIRLDSPGPVLFVQQRVGLKKRLFPLFKFRSMYTDAEERLKEIEHLNEAEGPIFKMKNDPRVTPVGKFLRKTSLDELPQLFNVLRGEMSLVGPRPMSIRDVDMFDKGIQRKRFSVKPGITCIWQISGRSNLPFQKWLELDLEYISKWTLWLDLKILVKTIPAVLFSNGAM